MEGGIEQGFAVDGAGGAADVVGGAFEAAASGDQRLVVQTADAIGGFTRRVESGHSMLAWQ